MKKCIYSFLLILAACGGGGGGNSGPPTGPGPIFNTPPTFEVVREVEPNDDLMTATPLVFPNTTGRSDVAIGLGNIHDTSDVVDTYSFTPNHSKRHFFQLCDTVCNLGSRFGNLDVSVTYFDVLDASGNVLSSTAADASSGNLAELAVDAGVLYYVMVIAENTANLEQHYSINIIDDE